MDAPTQVAQQPKKEFSYDDATQILDMTAPLPKKQNDFQLPLPRTNHQKLLNQQLSFGEDSDATQVIGNIGKPKAVDYDDATQLVGNAFQMGMKKPPVPQNFDFNDATQIILPQN